MRSREPQLITPAELRRRLQVEIVHAQESEITPAFSFVRFDWRSYRAYLAAAIRRLDAGGDPNTIIADWSTRRPRPGRTRGRTWFWPRRPTDAVVVDPDRTVG